MLPTYTLFEPTNKSFELIVSEQICIVVSANQKQDLPMEDMSDMFYVGSRQK